MCCQVVGVVHPAPLPTSPPLTPGVGAVGPQPARQAIRVKRVSTFSWPFSTSASAKQDSPLEEDGESLEDPLPGSRALWQWVSECGQAVEWGEVGKGRHLAFLRCPYPRFSRVRMKTPHRACGVLDLRDPGEPTAGESPRVSGQPLPWRLWYRCPSSF